MYNLWELNITHPFLRLDFLQPGEHYPKMSTKNIEVEVREKKKIYVFYFRLSALDYYFFFIRNNPLIISFEKQRNMNVKGSFKSSSRQLYGCGQY